MRGYIQVGLALKVLEQAIPLIGTASDEGRALLDATAKLSKAFGSASGDLTRAETKMLGERAGGVNQPGPQQMQAFQQMIKGKLGGMGLGGGGAPAQPQPQAAPAA